MTFTNPYLLFGLFAILVPVLIHLFNFRRYKTVYFSNVRMLDEIQKKTRRKSQLQQLVVLALRILGIAALVFAAAQPFLKNDNVRKSGGNLISVFVDNSFSMDANSDNTSSLYEAIDAAKTIVGDFNYDDDFVLTTQDFSGEESHILNKDQIIEALDQIGISPNSRSFSEIRAFESNTAQRSTKANVVKFYISDFQKNNFDLSLLRGDSSLHIGLVPSKSVERKNVSVDSCWFLTPVFRVGNIVTLMVRLHNHGEDDLQKLPVKLHVNDRQKAISTVDIVAGGHVDCRLSYKIEEKGSNLGRISIEDAPITFDDELFFTYNVSDNSNVYLIHDKTPNRFLNALYAKDSVFNCHSDDYRQVNYTVLKESNLVVLNEVPALSSGLADELSKFVEAGGTLLIFPPNEADASLNAFLSGLGCGTLGTLVKSPLKCGKINMESPYFNGAMASSSDRVDLPATLQHVQVSGGSQGGENVMVLEDGSRLLTVWSTGAGRVALSSVALDDEWGNAHRHALFFVPLHNLGILTSSSQKLYNIIGADDMQRVGALSAHSDDVLSLRARKSQEEFIPEQRRIGNETALFFHDQVHFGDWYDIVSGGQVVGTLAFNYSRKESEMAFYDEGELSRIAKETGDNVKVVDSRAKNIAKAATGQLEGRPLWPLFLLIALACFLAEIAVLRFWSRPIATESKDE